MPARTPTGGMNITSSGISLISLVLSPLSNKSYISKWTIVLPFLLSCMSLMVPVLFGPPASKRAFTRVEKEDTVYAPGLSALPTI